MADWSGECFEDPNAVNGSGRDDPDTSSRAGPGHDDPTEGVPGQWGVCVSSSPRPGQPPPSLQQPAPAPEAQDTPAPGWPSTPSGRKDHKRWLVLVAAAGAVLVAVAAVVVITLADRDGGRAGGSAGDVVKHYLEALARADAGTALSYGIDPPASTDFLTDDILKKQVAQWPLHNIKILHDNSAAPEAALSMAHVHLVAMFGEQTSDTVVDLKMDHNRWKLASAAIKFTPGLGASMGNAAAKTVTLFGKPIHDATAYVFPGWIDIGTTNPYMTVTVPPLLLDQFTMAAPFWVHPTFALADTGRDAVRAQLAAVMANCQKSHLLAPAGCPVHLDPDGLVESSVVWGPADLSAVKLDKFDPYRMTQAFSGRITVPTTVKTSGGATRQADATEFLSGTADLTKTPPELIFR